MAAVGLAVGGGLYVAAVGATLIILCILAGIKPIERRFWSERESREFMLVTRREEVSLALLQAEVTSAGMNIRNVSIEASDDPDEDDIRLRVERVPQEQMLATLERLGKCKGVRSASLL